MNRSVELSKEGAGREIADGVQVFTTLKESVERSQAELIDTIKEKQRETEEQAEGFIKELEQEVSELKKRSSEVKGKTGWDLGVARESINRKGIITPSPQEGFLTIVLRNENEYKACAGPRVRLSLKSQPEKVGVFVDYEEGLVSFYDVDAAALIYSFTGYCFKEKLYPYFSPHLNYGGKNSAPLIISPVNHTE
ncbi:hypothetical protein JOQ06_002972 [Pogonophryne albipinna]|uniref:B30.2/SPRY domain-containing protein n=1 Tax=Pogonophryne albipinna TaxID=1090488 RepID=A0AAD6BA12_9TELE|nr:hypothetical protein JOQ06_002972 [Pogonophryne albipinna]